MDYYKVSFNNNIPEETRDLLTFELGEIGFESFDESDQLFHAYIGQPHFSEEKLNSVCEFVQVNYATTELIPTQNWNASWESNYAPIEIDDLLRIRAGFHESKPGFQHEIVIVPKMSFGTGHHETTRLMAKSMQSIDFKHKTVLDMGCGTGILAIFASKLGAERVSAIDIEDFAFENSLENVQLNGCSNIFVEKGSIEKIPSWNFHIILANINKNILLDQIVHYAHHLQNRGNLFLSGFFETDAELLIHHCERVGMEFVSQLSKNNWTCLQFKKR